ncbi:MAG: hypothetical protein U0694_08505 [Anaerolineae bacterium]
MKNAQFYDLTQETQGAMFSAALAHRAQKGLPPFNPPPLLMQVRRGYAESPAWFMAQAAEFLPEPLTVAKLRVRDIYASEKLVKALLQLMASEKWFDVIGEEYHLTEAGLEIISGSRQRTTVLFADFAPIPQAAIERLEALLHRVLETTLTCPEPPSTWSLLHSRNRAPAADAPAMQRLFHHFSDINAARDDAHMAAFMPHKVDGYVWEAFSFVCNGLKTADELFDQLAYRGYSRHDYADALKILAARRWVQVLEDGYHVTDSGRIAREKVEQLTDDYFYAGWTCLDEDEFDEVYTLLNQLKSACESIANG